MKKLCTHPLFMAGLLIRVALLVVMAPPPVTQWYVPFLEVSGNAFSIDPWGDWLAQGGVPAAFPYGYVMWLVFLPAILFCKTVGIALLYGYGATLIAIDMLLLLILRRMSAATNRLLLAVYWLSPIVIVATYVLGFNDVVPVALLMGALHWLKQHQFQRAGFAVAAAISAKLSMLLALPFVLIYLLNNRALRQFLITFIKGVLLGAIVFLLPFFLWSSAGVRMVFSNPEMGKIYQLAIPLGEGAQIYLVPLAYLLMLYAIWRVRRVNFELFHAMLGLAFLLVVLMTQSSPGWFVWTLPLLVLYQLAGGRMAILAVALFSALFVANSLMHGAAWLFPGLLHYYPFLFTDKIASLIHTMLVAAGMVLAMRMLRETVSRNDYFRLSRKPFVLGIAGDSGSGKDTLAEALQGLFGAHSVARLSGDDYHLWDRQKPMWQVMTHLNPMANDLEGFANDLVALTDGKTVQPRHYDHETGRKSRSLRIHSNDIIIASGLHALYLPIVRKCCNLSIYLDMDEGLRRALKTQRDVAQRGHTPQHVLASFEKREADSARFIRPQAAQADLVLSLQPIHPRMLEADDDPRARRFKLVMRARHHLNELSLIRVLVGVCGLHVDHAPHPETSQVELTIEGETSAQDMALAARLICPRIIEFLDITPHWQDGMMGLMQLITLSHIDQALTERFV